MGAALDRTYYFNSRFHPAAPPGVGQWVDLARDPSAAHGLIRLGISPRHDLPALLLSEAGGKLRVVGVRLSAEEALRLAAGRGVDGGAVTVFSSTWCPDCRRAKRVLAESGVSFREVIVDEDLTAEALVLERSGGRRVVPTLRFGDRVLAFNPDPALLRSLLLTEEPAAST